MLGGVGLGFANVVRPGRVGVVAAAGTGAQEMMTLLDRWGIGVSCVVGVGGRDLSSAVGGRMALTVDGIEPRKGSETLVRAIALLRDGGLDPVLAVVGGHSFQDYRAYRERVFALLPELGLAAGRDIALLGTVADAEPPSWYAAADVFAFPSTKEGWGLAVLEAMSAELPVVASDLPVFREYLTPGRDALLVPVDSPAALAGALTSVLGDPNSRSGCGRPGGPWPRVSPGRPPQPATRRSTPPSLAGKPRPAPRSNQPAAARKPSTSAANRLWCWKRKPCAESG